MTPLLDWTQAVGHGEPVPPALGLLRLTPGEGTWGVRSLDSLHLAGHAQESAAAGKEIFVFLHRALFSPSRALQFLGIVLSPGGLSHTFGGRSAVAEDVAEFWTMKNRRRLYLIDRKYAAGLATAEEAELSDLQAALAGHLEAVAPLPFDALERLEALAGTTAPDQEPAPE